MCSVVGKPSDGKELMFSDRPSGPLTISFSQPVSAFGAYWGSGLNCPVCCSFSDAPTILTFKDASGNLIGSDSFFYKGNGTLMWRGYRFSRPVKTIIRTAGDGQEGVAIDGLQVNVASGFSVFDNLSTRGFAQAGDNVIIGGFIISGSAPKQVLLRGLGPSLSGSSVPNVMANPTITLLRGNTPLAFNDNWQSAANSSSIALSLAPPNPLESAILVTLNPGSYTAIIRGAGNTVGNTLFEVYDLNPTAVSNLANISTRGFVQTGDEAMIAGVIVGPGSKNVLIRALGPTLAQSFQVPNTLPDPFLDLRNANGTRITANDNWKSTQQAQIQATGLAPMNDAESAIAITLPPGNYTAIVRGANNTIGNSLVEVYGLP